MRGVAAILAQRGARVIGSDLSEFAGLGELVARGVVVHIGHAAAHLPEDTELVVASAAIPASNPELTRARALGIPVVSYAELIGRLMSAGDGVSVAGTHGKSTTTALTAYIFRHAGLDPSFVVGAESRQLGGGSGVGCGRHFIVESCEFARSFLHQRPLLAAILNIEQDHLDCYSDLPEIVSAFRSFAGNVSAGGVIVANGADPRVAAAVENAAARVETFGFGHGVTWGATEARSKRGRYTFQVCREDTPLFETSLRLAGRHNVLNALAATALACHGGAAVEAIDDALRSFEGIERRMSLRGTTRGATVVDDYAHHPTEIAATLRAVRSQYQPRRTLVVFQPHQHSRTRVLMEEFARCFEGADVVLVPDIYSARDSEEERRLTGSSDLVERISAAGGLARYVPALEDVTAELLAELTEGDLVVTMGAGDVWKVADGLVGRG